MIGPDGQGWDILIAFAGGMVRVVLVLMGLALSLSASASAFTEPGFTGTWADFANCPASVIVLLSNNDCEHSYVTGGVVQIGHSSVPISVPGDTLDVGVTFPVGAVGSAVSAPHGILNGPAQPVPGGLLGTIGNIPLTGVVAKLEWASPVPANTVFGFVEGCGKDPLVTFDFCKLINARSGTAVTMRVKIHVMSPFLGPTCYIGSAANPILIQLTTGVTNPPLPAQPIHGRSLEFLKAPYPFLQQAFGFTLVSNSFAVPAATGCGTSGGNLVDASISHKLGLPSPPGLNMIAISAIAEQAPASQVLIHGWTGE
jgi:hypothetical protein